MNASLARRAEEVLKRAQARRLTLVPVESCTAGHGSLKQTDSRRSRFVETFLVGTHPIDSVLERGSGGDRPGALRSAENRWQTPP
jgi:hypothetical protein